VILGCAARASATMRSSGPWGGAPHVFTPGLEQAFHSPGGGCLWRLRGAGGDEALNLGAGLGKREEGEETG
jgi:hypothetical protein